MIRGHIDHTTPGFEHPGPSEAEQFFYDNGGFSYNPATETPEEGRWRGALALRKAELHAQREGWYVEWEIEDDPIGWDEEDGDPPYDQFRATLRDAEGECLGGLGSIDLGPDQCMGYNTQPGRFEGGPLAGTPLVRVIDPYVRVVEAELALDVQL